MRYALVFGYKQKPDGALDPQTKARCKRAAALFRKRAIDRLYLTCAPDVKRLSMATAMQRFLVHIGVPKKAIVCDRRGFNTAGEMDVFFEHVPKSADVVFISSTYHLFRIEWLAYRRGCRSFKTVGAKAYRKSDLFLEVLKIANAMIRPFYSKVLSTAPHDLI